MSHRFLSMANCSPMYVASLAVNGKLLPANGKLFTYVCRIACGQWQITSCQWQTVHLCMSHRLRSMANYFLPMANCSPMYVALLAVNGKLLPVNGKLFTYVCRIACCQWQITSCQWQTLHLCVSHRFLPVANQFPSCTFSPRSTPN